MRGLFTAAAIAALTIGAATSELRGATQQSGGTSARVLAPIPLEEGVRYEAVLGLQPSPDRTLAAFTFVELWRRPRSGGAALTFSGLSTSFAGSHVRVVDVRTGRVDTLADDPGGRWTSWAPSWSPDGASLAFISDRDGHPRIWRWERASGRVTRVSDVIVIDPTRRFALQHWRSLQWTPDGRTIVTRVVPEGMDVRALAEYSSGARAQGGEPLRTEPTAEVFPRSAREDRREASGEVGAVFMVRHRAYLGDLVAVSVHSGAVARVVRRVHAERYDLSPDGAHLALFDESSVRIVQIATSRQVASDPAPADVLPNVHLQWSPGSDVVLHLSKGVLRRVDLTGATSVVNSPPLETLPVWSRAAEAFLAIEGARIIRLSLSGAAEPLATLGGSRFVAWLFADESEQALFSKPTEAAVWFLASNGELEPPQLKRLSLETGQVTTVDGAAATEHDRMRMVATLTGRSVFYLHEDAWHAPNYRVAEPGVTDTRQLTHTNAVFERHVLGEQRLIEWTTGDGERRRGALLLPAGYTAGTRVPMVVWVYGDTRSVAGKVNTFGLEGLVVNMQLLASRGYAVLIPESVLKDGTPMLDLAKNILPGVTRAVELGIADERRLGVMGHSFGGYSTLALIVQTRRFRAAIAYAGISNLASYWGGKWDEGESETIAALEERSVYFHIRHSPWQARRLYVENSPFFYLDRVTTPLLLIHGDVDPVPVLQADQVYFALRRLGKPVEYARYRNVSHRMGDVVNELDLWRRYVDWFDRHLKADAPASRE